MAVLRAATGLGRKDGLDLYLGAGIFQAHSMGQRDKLGQPFIGNREQLARVIERDGLAALEKLLGNRAEGIHYFTITVPAIPNPPLLP